MQMTIFLLYVKMSTPLTSRYNQSNSFAYIKKNYEMLPLFCDFVPELHEEFAIERGFFNLFGDLTGGGYRPQRGAVRT